MITNRLIINKAMLIEAGLTHENEPFRMRKQIAKGDILAFFPLHDPSIRNCLIEKWLKTWNPLEIPLYEIKEYFGEKIALYIALRGHYTTWVLLPACLGMPLQIAILAGSVPLTSPFLAVYALTLALWATGMVEFWKRKEKSLALSWGTIGYEKREIVRSEYQGKNIQSPVDGSPGTSLKFL